MQFFTALAVIVNPCIRRRFKCQNCLGNSIINSSRSPTANVGELFIPFHKM